MAKRALIKRKPTYTKKHLAIVFVLLTIAALFVLMGFTVSVASTVILVPDSDNPNIIHSSVPKDGSTPSEHNALESFTFAAERIYASDYFRGETYGTVVSDLGIMQHLQNVHNVRVVKGNYIFSEAISSSKLKSVAEQKFFAGKDIILYRPFTSVNGSSATFASYCNKMSRDDFFVSYGVIPNEITKHVINTDTILSIHDNNARTKSASNASEGAESEVLFEIPQTLVKGDDGYYNFTLVLDPTESTKYYRNEVMTLAGANYINFKSVELTVTIDDNWYPVSVLSNEVYEISIPSLSFMGVMTMSSSLTETFTDIDGDGEIPEFDFFSEHFDAASIEGGTPTLSAADYLAEAFGPYLAGTQDLDLKAEISVDGNSLGGSLLLSVNLETTAIKAKLGGLSIQYIDDKVYITNNNLKGYISVDKAKALLNNDAVSSLLSSINLDGLDESLLASVLENCEMSTEDGVTTVRLPFSLTDGIDIDASLVINDEDMSLKAINGIVKVKGTEISLKAAPNTSKFPAVDSSYKDISAIIDFVTATLGTALNETTYGVKGQIDALGYAVDVDAYIDRSDELKAEAVIKVLGQDIAIKYIDGVLYAEIYNIKVKASGEDILELISAIKELVDIDTTRLDRIKALLPDNVVGYINLLDNINVNEDTLSVDLKFITVPAHIELKRTGDRLSALKLDLNASVLGNAISANAELKISAPTPREVNAVGSYIDVKDLLPILPHIKKYIDADGLDISVSAEIDSSKTESPISITGSLKLTYIKTDGAIDGISLFGTVDALGTSIDITVAGGTVYAATGNIKLKVDIDNFKDIIAAIKILVSGIMDQSTLAGLNVSGILSSLSIDSVRDGNLTVSLNAPFLSVAVFVAPESGDVTLDGVTDSATISASAHVTPLYDATYYSAPEDADEYSDVSEFTVTVDKVTNVVTTKGLSAPVSVSVGDFALSALVSLDFTNGLALKIDGTTAPISVTYIDGTAYITVGDVKLSCDKAGLNALISSLDALLPDNIKQTIESLDNINIEDIIDTVLSAIKQFAVTDGTLSIKADILGVSANIELSTDLSSGLLTVSLGGTEIKVELGAVTADTVKIDKPSGAFIPAEKIINIMDAVLPLALADGYKISIDGSVYGVNITGDLAIALPVPETDEKEATPFGLSLTLDIADIKGISLTITDGVLYLVIPNTLSVSCNLSNGELTSLIDDIKTAIPSSSDNATVSALTDMIKALTGADIFDIIGALYGGDLDDGLLLGFDFNPLGIDLAAQLKIILAPKLNGVSLSIDSIVKADIDIGVDLDENKVIKTISVRGGDDDVAFELSIKNIDIQHVQAKKNCTPISVYSQLISPILSLIDAHSDAKTISIDVNASITKKTTGNYVDVTCKNLTVSFGEKIALRAVITLFSATDAAQDVAITFVDGIIYIEAGTVALSFDTSEDVERIYAVLEKYLPAYLAEELKNLLGLGGGTSSFSEIGLLVDRIKSMVQSPTVKNIVTGLFTDLGALYGKSTALTMLDMIDISAVGQTPIINATVMGITLKITPLLVGGDALQLVGAEVSTEVLGMVVRVTAFDLVSYGVETAIPAPTDRQYVSIVEFVQAIDMAIGTFTTVNPLEQDEITFDIPYFSFVYDLHATDTDPADTIKVTGNGTSALKGKFTKHTETDKDGNESSTFSVSLEAHISLDMLSKASSTGVIDIDLYVMDRYPDSPVAYLGYVENKTGYGELVSIDFTSVMQILAAVMDIIDVDDDTVEALVGTYRMPIDTSIFEYMSIMGLDSVKDMLSTLATTLNNVSVAIDDVKAAADIVTGSGSFEDLKNSLDDVKAHIENAIGLFASDTDSAKDNAQPEGSAIDGAMFKRIVSGVAFGNDEYNVWADIANEITTGANGVANILVASDGNVLNRISVQNLDANTAHVDMDVKFVAGGAVEMSPAPTKEQYKSKVDYSDLGNIKHLLFDVMNTANLAEFEIGGSGTGDKIKLSLSLISILNDSITIEYNVKVKLLTKSDRRAMGLNVTDDEPEIKTAAYVELIYQDCSALGMVVVGDCTTRLYFFDDMLYIDGVRDWEKVTRGGFLGIGGKSFYDCTREYRVYTLDDLAAMFEAPSLTTFFNDFLFLLVPLSKSFSILKVNLQKTIMDEIAKGNTSEDANPTIATVFKGYTYDGAKHTATVGLKELTGSTSLSDITVSLIGANDGDDNILDNYVTAAQITTGAIGVSAANVKLDLTATLRNTEEYVNDGTKMIRSKGLSPYTVHDVYLNSNKVDVGKNVTYPDIMSLLLGELPIAGSTANTWQYA